MTNEKLGVATEPSPESLLLGGLYICAMGLDILDSEIWTNITVLKFFIFQFGGWRFVSEGLSPPKPPVAMGLCGKTSACFINATDSEK